MSILCRLLCALSPWRLLNPSEGETVLDGTCRTVDRLTALQIEA